MKTPKRTQRFINAPARYESEFVGYTAVEHARWKRKNRVAWLKRTIARCKRIEHLPFYTPIWQACRLILDLKRPGKKADLNEYNQYFQQLEEISVQL